MLVVWHSNNNNNVKEMRKRTIKLWLNIHCKRSPPMDFGLSINHRPSCASPPSRHRSAQPSTILPPPRSSCRGYSSVVAPPPRPLCCCCSAAVAGPARSRCHTTLVLSAFPQFSSPSMVPFSAITYPFYIFRFGQIPLGHLLLVLLGSSHGFHFTFGRKFQESSMSPNSPGHTSHRLNWFWN